MVRPSQAKGIVRLSSGQDFVEHTLENSASPAEPTVPIAETFDAGRSGYLGLALPGLGKSEVIKAETGRQPGLFVAFVKRPRFRDVSPFREPGTPPCIVLWNRMELR
jgi:hypothetical protein